MIRFASILSTCSVSLLALGAVPALAQGTGYYSATPTAKVTKTSMISRGTVWKCVDGICSAPKTADRPGTVCQLVVQRVGALSAFTANGAAFDESALAHCNARAK